MVRMASRPGLERTRLALLLAIALIVFCSLAAMARKKEKKPAAAARMSEEQAALHLLNRATFGPRPGDVDRVRALGIDNWLEQQLHPDRIDDGSLQSRLAPLLTLKMDTRQLIENFPPPQVLKAVADGKMPMPSDPARRAVYQAQIAAYEARKNKQQAGAQDGGGNGEDPSLMSTDQPTARHAARMEAEDRAEDLLNMPPEQRYEAMLRMAPEERRMVEKGLTGTDRDLILSEFTPRQRETVMALQSPQRVIMLELQEGKLLRDVYSERQLQEVMTDFWFNHFNVFIGKGADHYLLTSYERDVIRPHALGKFKDLLEATAKSPAMLFYLDNWLSVGPHSPLALYGLGQPQHPRAAVRRGPFGGPAIVYRPPRQQRPQQQANNKRQGLNENYGRELMELHTLGVNGGYTQKDVTEVAKVFTGWTIEAPRKGGGFQFNERMHEPGPKYVLGHTIKEHGEKEGEEVLGLLAKNPATAKFVCRKLAMRFVADDPPPGLVDRMAETFLTKDGDISEVLRTMFHSPEFWAPDAYRAKVKTPLEFVASATRATGADISNPLPLVLALNRMGMPLYGMQPPTGYSMKADAWVNSAALLERMNFALALGTGRLNGVRVDMARMIPANTTQQDATVTLGSLENSLLDGTVSRNTHETILKQLNDPQVTGRRLDDPQRPPNVGVIAGLLLGSPEFQRR